MFAHKLMFLCIMILVFSCLPLASPTGAVNSHFVPDGKTLKMSMTKSTGEIVVTWADLGGTFHEWFIQPHTLQPLFSCPGPLDCSANESSFPCYEKCIGYSARLISYDKKAEAIYFIVSLDYAQNVPWAFFKGDLRKKKVEYLFTDEGSDVQEAEISPTGNWFSYNICSHGGACANECLPRIYDLLGRRFIKVLLEHSIKGSLIVVESSDWVSETDMEFGILEYGCSPKNFSHKRKFTFRVSALSTK